MYSSSHGSGWVPLRLVWATVGSFVIIAGKVECMFREAAYSMILIMANININIFCIILYFCCRPLVVFLTHSLQNFLEPLCWYMIPSFLSRSFCNTNDECCQVAARHAFEPRKRLGKCLAVCISAAAFTTSLPGLPWTSEHLNRDQKFTGSSTDSKIKTASFRRNHAKDLRLWSASKAQRELERKAIMHDICIYIYIYTYMWMNDRVLQHSVFVCCTLLGMCIRMPLFVDMFWLNQVKVHLLPATDFFVKFRFKVYCLPSVSLRYPMIGSI